MTYVPGKIRVLLGRGVDTKTNQKSVTADLLDLRNGVFDENVTIVKRPGYERFLRNVVGSGNLAHVYGPSNTVGYPTSISASCAMAQVGDELVLFDRTRAYVRMDPTDEWAFKGHVRSVTVDNPTAITLPSEQINSDVAEADGVTAHVWQDMRVGGGVRYSLYDSRTGTVLVHDRLLQAAPAMTPKARATDNGKILLLWVLPVGGSDGKIRVAIVNPRDPMTELTQRDVATDVMATQLVFGAETIGNNVLLVYPETAGNPKGLYVTSQGQVGTATGSYGAPGNPTILHTEPQVRRAIDVAYGANMGVVTVVFITGSAAGGTANGRWMTMQTSLATGSVTLKSDALEGTGSSVDLCNVAVGYRRQPITQNTIANDAVFFWELSASDLRNNRVKHWGYDSDGALEDNKHEMRHCGLATRPFSFGRDIHFTVANFSTLQNSYWTVDHDTDQIFARHLPSLAAGMRPSGTLPNVQLLSGTDQYQWSAIYRNSLDIEEGPTGSANASFGDRGIKAVRMDFGDAASHRRAVVDRTLYLGGGMLWEYDGHRFTENGFHVYPENVRLDSSNGAGSLTVGGTYFYRFYWEAFNARGERTLSTTAGTVSITLTGSDDTVVATVPTIAQTLRSGSDVPPPRLAVYRSLNNGPICYRVDVPSSPTYNDPNADTITFTDTVSDLTLATRELDYLNAEVDHSPPPPCSLVAAGKDRLFVAGLEDPNEIRFSKLRKFERTMQFNDLRSVFVDTDGGPITALEVMDDKVVVFKARRVFVFNGEGPNDQKADGTAFSEPQLVTSDVGCEDPRLLALTPMGIVFKSRKGWYVLDRGLGLRYIGEKVSSYDAQEFSAVEVLPDVHAIVMLAPSGRTLYYDYQNDQWSTFVNHTGIASAAVDSTYHYARSDGTVMSMTTASYTDEGTELRMRIRTGWIRPADTYQDFARFRRANFLGDYYSPHKLRVKVFYDYEEQPSQIREFNTSGSLIGSGSYGATGSLGYGSGPYGGDDQAYRWTLNFNRQKASAVSFEIEDVAIDDAPGRGYSLTEIVLEVLLEPGPARNTTRRTQ